jgi:hypothetical protein
MNQTEQIGNRRRLRIERRKAVPAKQMAPQANKAKLVGSGVGTTWNPTLPPPTAMHAQIKKWWASSKRLSRIARFSGAPRRVEFRWPRFYRSVSLKA